MFLFNDYDEQLSRKTLMANRANGVFRLRGMGVDLTRFTPGTYADIRTRLGQELGVDPAHTFVLCAARLIADKGVLDFVEAARQVCSRRRDAVFLLAGRAHCSRRCGNRCMRPASGRRSRCSGGGTT